MGDLDSDQSVGFYSIRVFLLPQREDKSHSLQAPDGLFLLLFSYSLLSQKPQLLFKASTSCLGSDTFFHQIQSQPPNSNQNPIILSSSLDFDQGIDSAKKTSFVGLWKGR